LWVLAATAAQIAHTGQVRKNPNPKVSTPTITERMNMTIPPGMVAYSIPKGPKRTAKMIATPTLFG
jgi:hypothetical protein